MLRAVVALAIVLGLAPSARAATVGEVVPHAIAITAAAGERNAMTVARQAGTLVVRDAGAPLTAGAPCAARPDGAVTCPAPPLVSIDLRDGDDVLRIEGPEPLWVGVYGGAGDDQLTYAAPPLAPFTYDVGGRAVTGGPVNLSGGAGDDVLTGAAGDEVLRPGAGADVVDGGPGRDELSYASETAPVTVDLAAGTGTDRFTGMEDVTGGLGDDVLLGTSAGERLDGGGGRDRVDGRAGDDVVTGHRAIGGDGDDRVASAFAAGRDGTVSCGEGEDVRIDTFGSDTQPRLPADCEGWSVLDGAADAFIGRLLDGRVRVRLRCRPGVVRPSLAIRRGTRTLTSGRLACTATRRLRVRGVRRHQALSLRFSAAATGVRGDGISRLRWYVR